MRRELKEKQVLLLIETLNRGGIETVLLRLIPKLKAEGWVGTVITIRRGGEMQREYEQAGIKVIPLGRKYIFSPGTLGTISRQINELKPDLIMTTLSKADAIGRLFLRFTSSQPVVPYLVTTYNHPRYRIARVFEWLTRPLADRYIANSEAVKNFYQSRLGVRAERIDVVPNAVDIEIFQKADSRSALTELQLPRGTFVITCVANLAPNKGQADLLEAFDQAFSQSNAYLILAGEGEQRQVLEAQRDRLSAKARILILGKRTDIPSILKITTVFALPTLFEGMSTALLEAMAAGKAIVTTDIPENKVFLRHNQTALLVHPGDRAALASALRQLADAPNVRERLSKAAFQQVKQRYSISKMAQSFALIFNRLCGESDRQSRPTVIHIISSLESGGAENMLRRTLPLLRQRQFEHVVVTLFRPGTLTDQFHRSGITTVNIGLKGLLDLTGLRRLKQVIARRRPALVITYLFHASLLGRLYLRNQLNAPLIPFLRTTYNFPRYFFARLLERLTKHLVGHYFANSEAVREYYAHRIGVDPRKVTVIHNGIDTALFEGADGRAIERELQLPEKRMVISCVANLAVNKGHTYLLEAFDAVFADHPESFLLIIGEGPERQNLENQATRYRSKKQIRFLGRRSDVAEILALTDIFVLPTMFEGLSNAILEAMAAGCAVIATDIPENRETIRPDQTGLLVPTQDSTAIAQAMNRLVKSRSDRDRLGRQAQTFVRANFDLTKAARQLEQAIQAHAKT